MQCEVCTLQWHWWSANSCVPASDYGCYKDTLKSKGYWVGSKAAWWTTEPGSCSGPAGPNGHFGCGEQFWNCADITVLASSGGSTAAASSSTTSAAARTTASTTTTKRVASTTTTSTMPPASNCKAVSGSEEIGATDDKCREVCLMLPAGSWPCGTGHACDCSDIATTATTMTTTAAAATTAAAGGTVCTPTQGLQPNGATDANCAQCARGYKWWPCNTNPAICTCSNSLAEVSSHIFQPVAKGSKSQHFLGTSLLQDGTIVASAMPRVSEQAEEL